MNDLNSNDNNDEVQRLGHDDPIRRESCARSTASARDLIRDLHGVIRHSGQKRVWRDNVVGKKTLRDRRVVLTHCLKVIHRSGFKLRRLENLRAEHLYAVVDDCRRRHLKPASIASYISHLRALCRWVNKPQLIDELSRYIERYPGLTVRSSVATRDKSLKGASVDPVEIIRRAADICPYFGCQLALGLAIGCRAQESWLFQPHLVDETTGYISITRGTKGGRTRLISTRCTYEHIAVLSWARALASDRSSWMIPPGSTLKKWRRRFYYLCEKNGLTRKQLKVTSHSFRHERMNELYEWLTGSESPIRGGSLHATNKDADRSARQVIAAVAGHNRIHVSGAYVGGVQASKGSLGRMNANVEQHHGGSQESRRGGYSGDTSSQLGSHGEQS